MGTSEPISGEYQPLSGQPGYIVAENPPFHPNILNLSQRQLGVTNLYQGAPKDTVAGFTNYDLYRGVIVTRPQTGQSASQFRVNFLYNPSTINENRTLDLNNQVLPSYARDPNDPGQYKTALNATVSFNLLFDRTYELWDASYTSTDAGKYGVLVDVNAFYNLLNINQLDTTTPNKQQSGGSVVFSPTAYGFVVQGTMAAVPVDLYFGYKAGGALKYFGFITGFDVTYTHFTQKMVAQRCSIGVSFQIMSDLQSTSS